MDAPAAARATAGAVGAVGSQFMLYGETYKRGAELGFQGFGYYVRGRGGVLGEVDADVVSAAFAFFEPSYLRAQWEENRVAMPADEAGAAWAASCAAWASTHVPDDLDCASLAPLLDAVVAEARPACAAVFCGWRALPVPTDPKEHVAHQMNALRELRHGLHAAAVVAAGLTPHQAVSYKSPQMTPIFGWPELAEATPDVVERWQAAEAATDLAMAHAFAGLDDSQRDQLVDLAGALHAATSG